MWHFIWVFSVSSGFPLFAKDFGFTSIHSVKTSFTKLIRLMNVDFTGFFKPNTTMNDQAQRL